MAKIKNQKQAGFGIRLLAWLIDAIIIGILGTVLRRALIFPPFGRGMIKNLGFLIGPLYSILLWVNWNGQTIGKKVMGIKIIKVDQKALDYPTAVARYLSYLVSGLVLCLGYFWIIWDERKQGWHDKIARTFVVKE